MANWFDERAKASARQQPATAAGLSRRQLIQRGALVTGAAWTAPMLLTATPAWAGASQCQGQDVFVMCPPNQATGICCAPGKSCFINANGTYFCDIPLGGNCGNAGNGICNGGNSRCNDQHKGGNICGGAGADCDLPNTVCFGGGVCSTGANPMCGGAGATCTNDTQCYPGDKNSGAGALTCQNNVCA
jgi:hypothetical protein